jgi:preprotein translocase subunit SecE
VLEKPLKKIWSPMSSLDYQSSQEKPSFFRPYKPGQGFWTRLGTGMGAALVILFTIHFLYKTLPAWTPLRSNEWPIYAILGTIAAVLSGLTWWLINRPRSAEFLIATDVEMKKVNWTSRRELIGSTKVVVFFMLFMAAVLFMYDLIFGFAFYYARVLYFPPFQF